MNEWEHMMKIEWFTNHGTKFFAENELNPYVSN